MADETDEIRSRIDIVDLVGQTVALKKAGKDFKGLCPFHDDKNPSFTVSPTVGRYRCWSCGEHGDIFTWVMKTRHLEFRDALELLAQMAGVTLSKKGARPEDKARKLSMADAMQEALSFFQDQLEKSTTAKEYCERRGLDKQTIGAWELGYAPEIDGALAAHLKRKGFSLADCKSLFLVDEDPGGGYFDKFRGRLMFPIRDEKGDLVAFGGRLLGDGVPKYINSGDTPLYRKSRVLYGMHRAKESMAKEHKAVLVEGYLDVIACHRAGVTGAIASLGTSLAEDHARLLKRWVEGVTILYDSDDAGQKAADRAIELLNAEGIRTRVALMPLGDDPDTLLRKQGPAAVQKAVQQGLHPTEYRLRALESRVSPASDEFWAQVVPILATSPTEMELERFITWLAPKYPYLHDPVAAQKALRQEVSKLRPGPRKGARFSRPQPKPGEIVKSPLHPWEIVLFRGLVMESFRPAIYSLLSEESLFLTKSGAELGRVIRQAFGDQLPKRSPSEWLHQVQPEEMQAMLADILLAPGIDRITEDFLTDTIDRLKAERARREINQAKSGDLDSAKRQEILDRIRKMKMPTSE